MTSVKGRPWPSGEPFVGFNSGDFTFGNSAEDVTDPAKWLRFGCPRGRGECLVAIRPQTFLNGAGWTWDGNREAPTLSPSIHCLAEKDGQKLAGCGWHGWLRNGEFVLA